MSKTLNTIQTIMKVARILCIVFFVLGIIGAAGCALAILLIPIVSDSELFMTGGLLEAIFDGKGVMYVGTAYFMCAASMIACVAEAVLAKLAERYFKRELEAGTPFTFEGAKELFKLGLINIFVMLGLSVAEGVIYGVLWIYFPYTEAIDSTASLTTGIWMLILSAFFKYGAEVAHTKAQENDDVKEEIRF